MTVGGVAAAGVLVWASPAFAHVTVHTDDPVRGASDAAVAFRTPDEEDHAATVRLQVFFPIDHPLLDVLVEPHPGWHFTTRSATLARPVTTDDGSITSAVSEVTWTADSTAQGLQPGEADDFVVIAGQLPDTPSITFRALQTYSNGDIVRWIESQAPGAVEPEHPAPVLDLTSGRDVGMTAPAAVATGVALTSAPSSLSGTRLDRGLAVAALVVALLAAGLGVVSIRRR